MDDTTVCKFAHSAKPGRKLQLFFDTGKLRQYVLEHKSQRKTNYVRRMNVD